MYESFVKNKRGFSIQLLNFIFLHVSFIDNDLTNNAHIDIIILFKVTLHLVRGSIVTDQYCLMPLPTFDVRFGV